jgi:hypothetical protein
LGFKEPRYDVTSDVLQAIRDKVGIGNEIDVVCNGVAEFRIVVLPPARGTAAAKAGETQSGSTEGNSPVGNADAPGKDQP